SGQGEVSVCVRSNLLQEVIGVESVSLPELNKHTSNADLVAERHYRNSDCLQLGLEYLLAYKIRRVNRASWQ
ncbi:hypothetical protein PMAYCL1PPCAC_00263, partial [Pristionchus mayeri]